MHRFSGIVYKNVLRYCPLLRKPYPIDEYASTQATCDCLKYSSSKVSEIR